MLRAEFHAHLATLLRIEGECFVRPQWGEENFLREVPGKWELGSLLREGEAIIGYLVASQVVAGTCHLHRMAVVPAAQGRGVGRAAVADLEARARAAGLGAVTLELDAEHSDRAGFYLRLGYRMADEAERAAYGAAKGKALRPDRRIMVRGLISGR
jgi:ribosomal protein S18 acetylase RimI-like enzyme